MEKCVSGTNDVAISEKQDGVITMTNELTINRGRKVLEDGLRDAYGRVQKSMVTALEEAISCGEQLAFVKTQVAHGEWLPLLESVGIARSTADDFIRFHEHRELIKEKSATNWRDAKQVIKQAKANVRCAGHLEVQSSIDHKKRFFDAYQSLLNAREKFAEVAEDSRKNATKSEKVEMRRNFSALERYDFPDHTIAEIAWASTGWLAWQRYYSNRTTMARLLLWMVQYIEDIEDDEFQTDCIFESSLNELRVHLNKRYRKSKIEIDRKIGLEQDAKDPHEHLYDRVATENVEY